jgi:hypothetical protein
MKTKLHSLFIALALLAGVHQAAAQGTAFTYQGRLNNNGSPASGTYNLTFTLFGTNTTGVAVAGPVTNSATGVSNGLFIVTLDFGGVFSGSNYWLEIGVRTNGNGAFTTLTPRQAVTPTPYAIFAEGASNVLGVVPGGGLSGSYSSAVTLNNPANSFNGSYTGNGSGLTSLNAASLNGLNATNFWQTGGNTGTSPNSGNFVGTIDNQPVELHVNGIRGWRLEPATNPSIDYSNSVNIVGGCSANFAVPGAFGATIAGGGAGYFYGTACTNSVAGIFATVGGGVGNTASNECDTVAGGEFNTAGGYYLGAATVGGGDQNTANGIDATVGGGVGNSSTNWAATVCGGNGNIAGGPGSFVGGGGYDGIYGQGNIASGKAATVAGGIGNVASGDGSFVGGGGYTGSSPGANTSSGRDAVVPGGEYNVAQGADSFAAGFDAQALYDDCFVWSDGSVIPFGSTAVNQFLVYAAGGVAIGTNAPQAQLHVTSSGGNSFPQAQLDQQNASDYSRLRFTVSGNANKRWDVGATATNFVIYSASIGANMLLLNSSGLTVHGTFVSSSDRNIKAGFEPVDTKAVLERVAAMPITRWHYTNDVATPHLGPMAQDFYAAFNVGMDDKHIATVDEEGVALAAIQGLNQKLEETRAENADLKQRLAALEKIVLNQRSN